MSSARSLRSRGNDAGEAQAGASTRFGNNDNLASAPQFARPGYGWQSTATNRERQEKVNSSTDLPAVLRSPAPYDLQSMRDLYTQIPTETSRLKRFGSEVFVNRDIFTAAMGISNRGAPPDVPLGPDYIVGAGDTLTIHLWGGTTQSITRIVDRDGRLFLPEAGSIQLAGLPLGKAESVIGSALKAAVPQCAGCSYRLAPAFSARLRGRRRAAAWRV